jgi:hypothetical protein
VLLGIDLHEINAGIFEHIVDSAHFHLDAFALS